MAALLSVNAAPIFKPLFANNLDKKVMMIGRPILAHLEHRTDFTSERGIIVPLQYGAPNSRSHDPTVSENNQNPGKYGAFTFTPVSDYLTSSLAGRVVRFAAAGGDRSYFVQVVQQEMTTALENFGINCAKEAYGSQAGFRSRIAAGGISGSTIQLENPQDFILWEAGEQFQLAGTAAGALKDAGDFLTIVSITDTGLLTADAPIANIATSAPGDYMFQRGDAQNGGTAKAMVGLADAVPVANPTPAENFYGVDRSVNRTHLAGQYFDGSQETMQTVFLRANRKTDYTRGGGFSEGVYFVNSDKFAALAIAYEGQRYIDTDNQYNIGIETFRVGGKRIMPDPFCPYAEAIQIGKGAFYRATCGDQPNLNREDGLEYRLMPGDVYQFQQVVDGQNIIAKPWALQRTKLPVF